MGFTGAERAFLWRNLGGSSGSTGMSCILMMRWSAPLLYCGPCAQHGPASLHGFAAAQLPSNH